MVVSISTYQFQMCSTMDAMTRQNVERIKTKKNYIDAHIDQSLQCALCSQYLTKIQLFYMYMEKWWPCWNTMGVNENCFIIVVILTIQMKFCILNKFCLKKILFKNESILNLYRAMNRIVSNEFSNLKPQFGNDLWKWDGAKKENLRDIGQREREIFSNTFQYKFNH